MPWRHEWVPPDVAFCIHTHNDESISVFHAYKDDNACERLCYWYTLCDGTSGQDRSDLEFDIRDFPTFNENFDHQAIMQCAYDNGQFTIDDVFICIQPGTTDAPQ